MWPETDQLATCKHSQEIELGRAENKSGEEQGGA